MLDIKVSGYARARKGVDKKIKQLIERISDDVLVVARSKTPIRLGRARRGWRKIRRGRDISVANTVPYIDLLEAGSSKQAPRGILKPTITEITRRRY